MKTLHYAVVVSAALLGLPHRAAAETVDLDGAMKVMAQNIAQALEGLGEESLSVGQFTGPPQLAASGGPGIAKTLIGHLEEAGVTVARRADLGLRGRFSKDADERGRPAAKVVGELVDEAGKVLLSFTQTVNATGSLASTLGLTFETPPDQPGRKQAEKVEEAIENPEVLLTGPRIKAAADSPYAIEILIKDSTVDDYVPVPAESEEGLAFVPIRRGDIYAVRLINKSPHDAAVTLTIDGLSVFAFSENKAYKHFILPAGTDGLIKGWHRTNEVSDTFQITEYSQSAAAELLPESGLIGTITATFAAAWPVGQEPPSDELAARFRSRGDAANATGRGPEVKARYNEVERETGQVRAAISVRYDKP